MIYLGNNQFGRGKVCTAEALASLKRAVLFKKNDPIYVSDWLEPKAFNQYPNKVDVVEIIPLKSIKLTTQWSDGPAVPSTFGLSPYSSKPKKDYSKMRILNRDA